MIVEGYALKWDTPTMLYRGKTWMWIEEIRKGALDESDLSNVVFNKNHDDNLLLARTTNGSLKLIIDDVGLKIIAELVNTAFARDVFEEIKTRLLDKMSFRWRGGDYDETNGVKDGVDYVHTVWTKLEKLSDVSVVAFPAYDDTSIEAARSRIKPTGNKSLNKTKTIKEIEDMLNG